MPKVDCLASARHYLNHLLPVWEALPVRLRGDFHIGTVAPRPDRLTLVAGWSDAKNLAGPVALLNHGSGQTYSNRNASYAGGDGRDNVVLFLNPTEGAATLDAAAYPDADSVAIGCPKLDRWADRPHERTGTVALSFHWDCRVAPESRTAFNHYRPGITLRKRWPWRMLGHGHPREWDRYGRFWRSQARDVEPVEHFDDVLLQADCYVVDNSSTLYEFAALDRPVVALNAPWYRKGVSHGLRFWDRVPGPQVERFADLDDAITQALDGAWDDRRREAMDGLYPHLGSAGKAAARAIANVA